MYNPVTNVVIAGGGSLSRVLFDSFDFNDIYNAKGFLDIIDHPYGATPHWIPQTYNINDNTLDNYIKNGLLKHFSAVLGVFNPKYRKEFVKKIGSERFILVLDGNIAAGSCINHGAVIMHGAYVMHNATIGKFAHIHTGSIIGHDAEICDYTAVGPGCVIGGGAVIGEGCAFGMNVSVLPKVKVAAGVTLGAGAVVTKDITEENITVVGCPAKKNEIK